MCAGGNVTIICVPLIVCSCATRLEIPSYIINCMSIFSPMCLCGFPSNFPPLYYFCLKIFRAGGSYAIVAPFTVGSSQLYSQITGGYYYDIDQACGHSTVQAKGPCSPILFYHFICKL